MNKQELISKIKSLQDISSEEKAYIIELVNTKKKYGLVWEEKPEDVEEQLRSMLPVFKEVKERAIISENTDAPNHILIEGDNLHALTALSYTHEGKVDVIYIDPPYNTGNKDFIYNDAYVDKEDTYRHSKWLSFMDKRLRLAKKLLSETGVIFISIDDNEQAQLKMLCNEIFGENNFISTFIWHKKYGGGGDNKNIVTEHEYVLSYSNKDPNINEVFYGIDLDFQDFVGYILDENGNYYSANESILMRGPNSTKEKRPNLCYEIEAPDGTLILPRNGIGTWCYSKETLNQKLNNKDLVWKKVRDQWMLYKKQYLFEENSDDARQKKPRTVLDKRYNVGQTGEGSTVFKEIMKNEKSFVGPKPLSLLKSLLNFSLNKNSIVLDFFAGSGSTLHAVMELNNEYGYNYKCILVTNNENKIAEEVTYERNKRVIQGYTNAKGEQVEGLTNNNLRYYQADFVPSERTEVNRRLLTARSTDLLCIKEDCFIEITKELHIKENQAKVFTNGLGKYMVVIYHSRNQDEVVAQLTECIHSLETTEKVKIYAFSPEKESIEEDFFAVADKIAAIPLPDSIYNAYRATFRTLKLNQKSATAASKNQDH